LSPDAAREVVVIHHRVVCGHGVVVGLTAGLIFIASSHRFRRPTEGRWCVLRVGAALVPIGCFKLTGGLAGGLFESNSWLTVILKLDPLSLKRKRRCL
jgi:hypothetical protein